MTKGYGFTYAGIHSDEYNLTATRTTQSITPGLIGQTLTIPRRPGGWYYRTDIGIKWISVSIALQPDALADFRPDIRAIAAWLSPFNGPQSLVFDNEPDKTYQALLDDGGAGGSGSQSTDIVQTALLGEGTLLFMIPDPFAYGAETSLTFVNGTAAPNVSGTYETFPRIEVTFTAAVVNFKVTNTNTGEFVMVDHAFAVNDKLTIDCAKSLIEINGVATMANLDLNSDFFSLTPGNNALSVDSGANATCTAYWTPRWL